MMNNFENKMKQIDKNMVFNEEVIIPLLNNRITNCKLKSVDDFEFTLLFEPLNFDNESYRKNLIRDIIIITGLNFWDIGKFAFILNDDIRMNAELNISLPVLIDVFIITSNIDSLSIEIIIYQNETSLFFDSVLIKRVNENSI